MAVAMPNTQDQVLITGVGLLDSLELGGEIIGEGSFGSVCSAVNGVTGKRHAVKKIMLDTLTSRQCELVQDEVSNFKSLNHDHLLKMDGCPIWKTQVYIVTPLMVKQSCDLLLRHVYPHGLPENAIGSVFADVLKGLDYLHEKRYVHRGIRASHILLGESGEAVLSGFRHTIQIPIVKTKMTAVTNLNDMSANLKWLSPEILNQDAAGYSFNSDMYSIGITACELANGVVPYADDSPSAMLVKKLEENPPRLWDKECSSQGAVEESRPQVYTPSEIMNYSPFTKDFHNFVAMCLTSNPMNRISSKQAIRHKFITSYMNKLRPTTVRNLPDHIVPKGTPVRFFADHKGPIADSDEEEFALFDF